MNGRSTATALARTFATLLPPASDAAQGNSGFGSDKDGFALPALRPTFKFSADRRAHSGIRITPSAVPLTTKIVCRDLPTASRHSLRQRDPKAWNDAVGRGRSRSRALTAAAVVLR